MADLVIIGSCASGVVQRSIQPSLIDDTSIVDLSGARWFTPFGLVSVLAFIEAQARTGVSVRFTPPTDPSHRSYLSRMRLGDRLDHLGVSHELPSVRSHPNRRLVELYSFESRDDVGPLAERIFDMVNPLDSVAARALYRSLCEAGENVEFHAGLSNGYMAAQTTRDWGTDPTLRFAVADSGHGFLFNLLAKGATDDAHALRLALSGVSSSTAPGNRGGLKSLAGLLTAVGGSITVSSGSAAVPKDRSSTTEKSFDEPFQGSVFEGVVPLRARAS